jgi:hypothetical protein
MAMKNVDVTVGIEDDELLAGTLRSYELTITFAVTALCGPDEDGRCRRPPTSIPIRTPPRCHRPPRDVGVVSRARSSRALSQMHIDCRAIVHGRSSRRLKPAPRRGGTWHARFESPRTKLDSWLARTTETPGLRLGAFSGVAVTSNGIRAGLWESRVSCRGLVAGHRDHDPSRHSLPVMARATALGTRRTEP